MKRVIARRSGAMGVVDVGQGSWLRASCARLGPPHNLLGRLRWSFLAFGWFFLVTFLPQVTVNSPRGVAEQVLAALLLLSLGVWWTWGYRRERFPAIGLPLEVSAFLAAGLVVPDPYMCFGLLYISVNFRAFYGSWRQVAAFTTVAIGSFLGVVLLTAAWGGPDRLPQLLQTLPGVPVLAAIAHLASVACQRGERAAARERVLSRAGLSLARAADLEVIRREAELAGTALLQPDPDGSTRVRVLDQVPSYAQQDVCVLPLVVGDAQLGCMVVEGTATLLPEAQDSLQVLGAQLGLRLLNVALTQDLRHGALHDGLTGLPNRSSFMRRSGEALQLASASGSTFSLLLIDLDGFKEVNDRFGHQAGDELLVVTARHLCAAVDEGVEAFRLGGDEFVVLAEGHGRDQAQELAAHLDGVLRDVGARAGTSVRVGASIGTATWDGRSEVNELLASADAAMYAVKRTRAQGRGGAEVPSRLFCERAFA